jgi:signal transduction histidine kinase
MNTARELGTRLPPALSRLAVDWVPAIALALAAAHELGYDRLGLSDWILAQSLIWPLVLRRRYPVGVLVVTVLVGFICWWQRDLFTSYVAVFFALHAVAASRPRAQAFAAAAVVEAGAVLISFRFAPNGSINDAVILLTAVVLTFLFLGTTQRIQRQYLSVMEERARQAERDRDQQALISAAEERTRIARELHDIVAHGVSVMVALSEGAAVRARTNTEQAQEAMRQVAATGRDALAELRKVVSVLREPAGPKAGREPQPTLETLGKLVDDVTRAGLPVSLTLTGAVEQLPEAVQLSVFRIAQEGLTNVLKHADRPTYAEIMVAAEPLRVSVRIQDDGRRHPAADAGPGNGIRGMRERAELFGGSLAAGWQPEGWQVSAILDPQAMR